MGYTSVRKYLFLILSDKLFIINLVNKNILRILSDKRYQYICFSEQTRTANVVTKEENEESTRPYYYCVYAIDHDLQLHRIMRYGPEIEIINISCTEVGVCVNANFVEKEDTHKVWVYTESSVQH